MKRQFVCYFFYVKWSCISLGASVDLSLPNLEIHLPCGFIRIGFVKVYPGLPLNNDISKRTIGYSERY
jgi:hypothetical protein